jgi:hypothetical protein
LGDKIKKKGWEDNVVRMREERGGYRVLVRKTRTLQVEATTKDELFSITTDIILLIGYASDDIVPYKAL